ncbi:hypothetical protein ABZV60_05020 [Streptomyces sp. NPDC004787]|uniref:hypothetical protein n=1 Tax=Streptomyces sp. NPDC004787 TaxID=3154291 RepID=UPI0033BBCE77
MTARTHTGVPTRRTGVDTRLPWWALALPVAAFVALLLLMPGPGPAPEAGGAAGFGHVIDQLRQTLPL